MSRTFASMALACGMILGLGQTPASAQTGPPQAVVRVVGLVVNSVVAQGDDLIANATMTLNVAGNLVTQQVRIPISAEDASCDILNLSVGPIDLNLLGLKVKLDDCDDGPITVDITAVPSGGLLGNLLCQVAGLLDNGLGLGNILGALAPANQTLLTGAIRDALNAVFADLLGRTGTLTGPPRPTGGQGRGPGGNGPPGQANGGPPGQAKRCDILNLEIPGGIHLNLLGLRVDTSAICLNISAQTGRNQLLGNLLCELVDLLGDTSPAAILRRQQLLAGIAALLGL